MYLVHVGIYYSLTNKAQFVIEYNIWFINYSITPLWVPI